MPSLETHDGRALSWRVAGSGPPLLLHPGGPGCSSRYFGELPQLAAKRTLVLLDPRGTGDSDRPAQSSAYDLEDYAADIEAVREELGTERLDLLGHSHGGFVAMVWGGTYPDRVGRLILADTAPRFTDVIRARRTERIAEHRGQPYFEGAIAALQDQQAGNYANDEQLAALYELAGVVYASPGEDASLVADAFRASGFNADAMKHFNHVISNTMDLRPLLERIDAPTLVIAGERDAFGGPTQTEIADALSDATVNTISGADHFPFLEPESRACFSRAVLDFLARELP